MKRPTDAGPTYLRPHVLHSHDVRATLPFDFSGVGDGRNWVCWGRRARREEPRVSEVESCFSMLVGNNGAESDLR